MSTAHTIMIYRGTRLVTTCEAATFRAAWRNAVKLVRLFGHSEGATEQTIEATRYRASYGRGTYRAVPQRRVRAAKGGA